MNGIIKDFMSSGLTSVFSMSLFYPLEITKVRLQTNQSLKVPIKTYYYGITKSLLVVFPEKGIKFTTFNYCQKNNYSFINSIILTSLTQTIISTPIENYRITRSNKIFNPRMYRGHQFTILRDTLFNYIFFKQSYKQKDFTNNILGGLLATSATTPFDVIKTKYQSGENIKDIIKKAQLSILIKGIIPRTLSVGGFYGVTYFLYQNLFSINN